MAGQMYGTQVGRHEKYKGRILAKAQTKEMLTKLGAMEPFPQNVSQTIEWMRFLPWQWMRRLGVGEDLGLLGALHGMDKIPKSALDKVLACDTRHGQQRPPPYTIESVLGHLKKLSQLCLGE
jgi:hypothetical protein